MSKKSQPESNNGKSVKTVAISTVSNIYPILRFLFCSKRLMCFTNFSFLFQRMSTSNLYFMIIVQATCIIVNIKAWNNSMKIQENIRFYRKQLNMTQGQLAEKLCAKKSLISNYENGYSTPDIFTLCKLADIFEISLDELVGRDTIRNIWYNSLKNS